MNIVALLKYNCLLLLYAVIFWDHDGDVPCNRFFLLIIIHCLIDLCGHKHAKKVQFTKNNKDMYLTIELLCSYISIVSLKECVVHLTWC